MGTGFVRQEGTILLLLLFIAVFAGAARKLRIPYPILLTAVFAGAARKLRIPYPILLTIVGAILGLVPVFPAIALEPGVVFFFFLPPLLFAAGWQLSWREFHANLSRILTLAVGLVLFTIVTLIMLRARILPGFDWQSALLLGAVIGATDAIAATSIARHLRLPRRIVELLEAESLVNDGTGLLAFQFALAILLSGHSPSAFEGIGKLIYLSLGGVLLGLLVGLAVSRLERWIDDGPIEIVISILICYAVYIVADQMHTSGILAVIACSMLMSRESPHFMSPQVRLQFAGVWDALTFVLNGIVFILIGLQLPLVMRDLANVGGLMLLKDAAVFCLTIIALRMIWIFAEVFGLYWYGRLRGRSEESRPSVKELLILTWGGMRGVLSLAAAFSIPYTVASGAAFRQRSMIVFLTFSLIVTSLVIQGLSMSWLIKALKIADTSEEEREEVLARRRLAEEAIRYLGKRRLRERFEIGVIRELSNAYGRRLRELPVEETETAQGYSRRQRDALLLEVMAVERECLLQLRDEAIIGDDVSRLIQRDLDTFESRIHTGTTDKALLQQS